MPEEVLLLSFLTLVRNRNAKEGYKGKMMSQKLLEGRRENQQPCYWKRSHPEFSKQLLPTESSLQSRYHAAALALGSACVFTLLGCSYHLLLFGLF